MASAVQLPFLPEVDHVHQQLGAGAAHEAGRMPQLVVAGSLGVDGGFAKTHRLLAVMTRLRREEEMMTVMDQDVISDVYRRRRVIFLLDFALYYLFKQTASTSQQHKDMFINEPYFVI